MQRFIDNADQRAVLIYYCCSVLFKLCDRYMGVPQAMTEYCKSRRI